MKRSDWILTVVAIALGIVIGMIDTRPGWDDTGISAAMVLIVSAIVGALGPSRAWLWGLAVGTPIVILNIISYHTYDSLLVLVVAVVGAYAGAFARTIGRGERGKA